MWPAPLLLFISPWVLGFSGDLTAARTAWAAIFVMAVAAMVEFATWEEWVAPIVGVLVLISPWVLRFAAAHAALWTCVVLGSSLSSISEIWVVHHPAIAAR